MGTTGGDQDQLMLTLQQQPAKQQQQEQQQEQEAAAAAAAAQPIPQPQPQPFHVSLHPIRENKLLPCKQPWKNWLPNIWRQLLRSKW